ncbi:MAG: hypothetical protein U5K53_08260 [Halanaerobiales bacterium]|nr:hypothetical protein [Halanaerobiales bacterium]
MKLIDLLKNGLNRLKVSVKRYPYALIFSTITTVIMIYLVNTEGYYNNEMEDLIARIAISACFRFSFVFNN